MARNIGRSLQRIPDTRVTSRSPWSRWRWDHYGFFIWRQGAHAGAPLIDAVGNGPGRRGCGWAITDAAFVGVRHDSPAQPLGSGCRVAAARAGFSAADGIVRRHAASQWRRIIRTHCLRGGEQRRQGDALVLHGKARRRLIPSMYGEEAQRSQGARAGSPTLTPFAPGDTFALLGRGHSSHPMEKHFDPAAARKRWNHEVGGQTPSSSPTTRRRRSRLSSRSRLPT